MKNECIHIYKQLLEYIMTQKTLLIVEKKDMIKYLALKLYFIKICAHIKFYVLRGSLFIVVRSYKQLKCPLTCFMDKQIVVYS
jgi:hypothetical protein